MAEEGDGARRTPEYADGFTVVNDETPTEVERPAAPEPDARALDAARVRQLSALRRGAYRTRSYCFVAVGICAVAVAQLALLTFRHVRAAGWQLRPTGYVCGAAAAVMAGAFFFRRAAELTRELRRRPDAREPLVPPDFSTLNDGSQSWKNLEQMQEGGS